MDIVRLLDCEAGIGFLNSTTPRLFVQKVAETNIISHKLVVAGNSFFAAVISADSIMQGRRFPWPQLMPSFLVQTGADSPRLVDELCLSKINREH